MLACVRTVGDVTDAADAEDALLQFAARLTPRIERHHDHPNTLVFDLAGCERLVLGGHLAWPVTPSTLPTRPTSPTPPERLWPMLAARLHDRLSHAMGVPTLVGLGPSRTVAWLAATTIATTATTTTTTAPAPASCTASWQAITPGQVAAFLRPLPLAARLSVPELNGSAGAAEMLVVLVASGLETVGQVAGLGATPLHRRFGPLGTRLATLAAGQDVTPLHPWTPPTSLGARVGLNPPAAANQADQLTPSLMRLAEHLAATLQRRHLGAGAITLVLDGAYGTSWRATRSLGQPTASSCALLDRARRLLAMLAHDAVGETTWSAIHLRAGGLRPLPARQNLLWPSQAERERQARRARLLATGGPLAGRHGAAAVVRAALVAPHAVLPEQRYTFVPLHRAAA